MSDTIYTVVSGDTLSSIAKKYKTTYQELAMINNLTSPYILQVGNILILKEDEDYEGEEDFIELNHIVKNGETLIGIAKLYGITYKDIAIKNDIKAPYVIYPNQILKIIDDSDLLVDMSNFHIVIEDETLNSIAKLHNTTYQELAKLNNIQSPHIIYPEDILNFIITSNEKQIRFIDDKNIPISLHEYILCLDNGCFIDGITDMNGYTEEIYISMSTKISSVEFISANAIVSYDLKGVIEWE